MKFVYKDTSKDVCTYEDYRVIDSRLRNRKYDAID